MRRIEHGQHDALANIDRHAPFAVRSGAAFQLHGGAGGNVMQRQHDCLDRKSRAQIQRHGHIGTVPGKGAADTRLAHAVCAERGHGPELPGVSSHERRCSPGRPLQQQAVAKIQCRTIQVALGPCTTVTAPAQAPALDVERDGVAHLEGDAPGQQVHIGRAFGVGGRGPGVVQPVRQAAEHRAAHSPGLHRAAI